MTLKFYGKRFFLYCVLTQFYFSSFVPLFAASGERSLMGDSLLKHQISYTLPDETQEFIDLTPYIVILEQESLSAKGADKRHELSNFMGHFYETRFPQFHIAEKIITGVASLGATGPCALANFEIFAEAPGLSYYFGSFKNNSRNQFVGATAAIGNAPSNYVLLAREGKKFWAYTHRTPLEPLDASNPWYKKAWHAVFGKKKYKGTHRHESSGQRWFAYGVLAGLKAGADMTKELFLLYSAFNDDAFLTPNQALTQFLGLMCFFGPVVFIESYYPTVGAVNDLWSWWKPGEKEAVAARHYLQEQFSNGYRAYTAGDADEKLMHLHRLKALIDGGKSPDKREAATLALISHLFDMDKDEKFALGDYEQHPLGYRILRRFGAGIGAVGGAFLPIGMFYAIEDSLSKLGLKDEDNDPNSANRGLTITSLIATVPVSITAFSRVGYVQGGVWYEYITGYRASQRERTVDYRPTSGGIARQVLGALNPILFAYLASDRVIGTLANQLALWGIKGAGHPADYNQTWLRQFGFLIPAWGAYGFFGARSKGEDHHSIMDAWNQFQKCGTFGRSIESTLDDAVMAMFADCCETVEKNITDKAVIKLRRVLEELRQQRDRIDEEILRDVTSRSTKPLAIEGKVANSVNNDEASSLSTGLLLGGSSSSSSSGENSPTLEDSPPKDKPKGLDIRILSEPDTNSERGGYVPPAVHLDERTVEMKEMSPQSSGVVGSVRNIATQGWKTTKAISTTLWRTFTWPFRR